MYGDALFILFTISAPLLSAGLTYLFFKKINSRRKKSNWGVILCGNILVFLVLASLAFACLEGYYRFFYDTTIGNNRSKVSKRWFKRYWHLNAQGIRDNIDYATKRQERKRRVTFVGDSFTAGHGVKDVEERFVNRLRRVESGWEVHGFADLGLSSRDELKLIQGLIKTGYDIDVVVLVYCFNDIAPFVKEIHDIPRRVRDPATGCLAWVIEHSYAINTFYHHWERQQEARSADGTDYLTLIMDAYVGSPWQSQEKVLWQIKHSVEEAGGVLAVVTFPLLLTPGDDKELTRAMHRRLNSFWKKLGVAHLDLLPVLEGEDLSQLVVNRFDDHPSAYAHGIVAGAIRRFLSDEVFPDTPKIGHENQ